PRLRASAPGTAGSSPSSRAPEEPLEVGGGARFEDRKVLQGKNPYGAGNVFLPGWRQVDGAVGLRSGVEPLRREGPGGVLGARRLRAQEGVARGGAAAAESFLPGDPSMVEEGDTVAEPLDFRELVGVQDDRRSSGLRFENAVSHHGDTDRVGPRR